MWDVIKWFCRKMKIPTSVFISEIYFSFCSGICSDPGVPVWAGGHPGQHRQRFIAELRVRHRDAGQDKSGATSQGVHRRRQAGVGPGLSGIWESKIQIIGGKPYSLMQWWIVRVIWWYTYMYQMHDFRLCYTCIVHHTVHHSTCTHPSLDIHSSAFTC